MQTTRSPFRSRPARPRPAPSDTQTVGLSEVLSALSHALDLTEGQPEGHTLRACLIATRIGEEIGLTPEQRSALYYTMLLKDAGCSSNAARMAVLFGSPDQSVKYRMKLVDWHQRGRLALQTAANVGRGRSLRVRAEHFLRIARTRDMTRDLIAIRCDRGAEIVRQLGFPAEAAEAVRSLDEHWSGKGYPESLSGEAIPLLARIALLAQTVEIFLSAQGVAAAVRVAEQRRGSWFDPRLVDVVRSWREDARWWASLLEPDAAERVIAAEPEDLVVRVDAEGLDGIARAFAEIIDAKTPFTFRHSANVADYARGVARQLGWSAEEQHRIHRAGLLHDIGKLGVSNRILDKNGPLTPEEREAVERHPLHTWQILSRVPAFASFAQPAALHHEKLDGSGYPWKLGGEFLDPAARILVVVDIFEALTADRPYRAGMPIERALGIIRGDAGPKLWADAVAALEECVSAGTLAPAASPAATAA